MKSIIVKFSTILIMFGTFAVVSFGQKTERIKFAAGETSGTYTRTIPAQGSMDFIINAKKRQYMDYTVAYDFKKTDIEAFLTEPNLQDVSQTPTIDARTVFQINTGGDHRLTVNNMTGKSVTFTLYLQISNDDPDADDGSMNAGSGDGDVERIELARNSVFAEFEISLAPGESKQFVAHVKKGFMVCVETNKNLGSNLKVEVDARALNLRKTATNSDCTANAIESRDQYIYFENSGKSTMSFTSTIGFYKE